MIGRKKRLPGEVLQRLSGAYDWFGGRPVLPAARAGGRGRRFLWATTWSSVLAYGMPTGRFGFLASTGVSCCVSTIPSGDISVITRTQVRSSRLPRRRLRQSRMRPKRQKSAACLRTRIADRVRLLVAAVLVIVLWIALGVSFSLLLHIALVDTAFHGGPGHPAANAYRVLHHPLFRVVALGILPGGWVVAAMFYRRRWHSLWGGLSCAAVASAYWFTYGSTDDYVHGGLYWVGAFVAALAFINGWGMARLAQCFAQNAGESAPRSVDGECPLASLRSGEAD